MSTITPDRFDLEQAILAAWTTKEDIDLLYERFFDGPPMTEDEVANLLIGISAMHQLRCQKMFDIFERLIAARKIV